MPATTLTPDQQDMPIADYLSLLKHGGTVVLVGAPENGAALKVQPFQLIMSESRVGSGLWWFWCLWCLYG